jgi:hypothetical protein
MCSSLVGKKRKCNGQIASHGRCAVEVQRLGKMMKRDKKTRRESHYNIYTECWIRRERYMHHASKTKWVVYRDIIYPMRLILLI